MAEGTLNRWGAIALILTAVLFALGGILAVALPGGGLSGPLVPLLYYLGTIGAVPALTGLYASQRGATGRLAFAGYVLGVLGAILYTGPQLALLAGTSGVATWHDIWGFAMVRFPVLTLGAPAFMIGMILLGIATARAGVLPGWNGWLLATGALVWLVAFVLSVAPGLLTVASLMCALALGVAGATIWTGAPTARPSVELA